MRNQVCAQQSALGVRTIQSIDQLVESLSGGQRQGVAIARAAAFASRAVMVGEPPAALGVNEARRVVELCLGVKKNGLPIVLISHNLPQVLEGADRFQSRRLTVSDPKQHTMDDAVADMTGAKVPSEAKGVGSD
jgi:fructose transport system ATP-binding protein